MVPARLLNLLLLAALALAAGRFWSFLREPPPKLPAPAATAAQETRAPVGPEAPAEAAPGAAEGYDVIVARDLFSPTRGVVSPAPEQPARPAAPPQPPPKLTLFGVVIVDGEKAAFLQEGSQETKPRKVREGERFAGGVLSAIRPDGVTFLFGGREIAVALRTPKEGISQIPPAPVQPGTPAAGAAGGLQGGAPAVFPRQYTPPVVRQPPPRVPQQLPRRIPPGVAHTPSVAEPEEDLGDEEYFQDEDLEEIDEGDEGDLLDSGEEDLEE